MIKKMLSIFILGLLLSLLSQICFASEEIENKIQGSIELIGYTERINGQEWNLTFYCKLTDKIKIGIFENIHQYQNWQEKDNEYNTNVFLSYKLEDQLEFYFVPWNSIESPYFKVKYNF
jgi:hypothetical protein